MAKYSIVHSVRVCTEFTPETYGRLTTIGPAFQQRQKAYQVCACECGNIITCAVRHLRASSTRSCGCIRREVTAIRTKTHGQTRSTTWQSWRKMRSRCNDRNDQDYADYGGRGITYCERWKKFENFFADMGHRPGLEHTLDRFPDKDGNYEPSNCRWADKREQANNRRNSRLVAINGKLDTIANWCRLYGINYSTAYTRIRKGCDPVAAITTPTS